LVIGGVEKIPVPGVAVEKILQNLFSRCDRNFNRKLNVKRVDAVSITAAVMLKLKWQRAGNRSVISVDRETQAAREKLKNALLQPRNLTRKNKVLEGQL
jgi:hypothetical protein